MLQNSVEFQNLSQPCKLKNQSHGGYQTGNYLEKQKQKEWKKSRGSLQKLQNTVKKNKKLELQEF